MKKGYVGGSWEIINAGHCLVFQRCKKSCDVLFVGLNTNKLLKSYKKREAVFPYKEKKLILESIKYVDKVIPVHNFSPLSILKRLDIDVYYIAEEWKDTKSEEIAYMKKHGKKVVYIPDFGLTRTSQVKERLLAESLARL